MIRRLTFFPLAIALIYFPSLKYYLMLDGAETEYYGFPLPWNSRSLVTSLAKDVYLLPFVLDLLFLSIVSVFILRAVELLPEKLFRSIQIIIWIWGSLSVGLIFVTTLTDPTFHSWPNPGQFQIREIKISTGS